MKKFILFVCMIACCAAAFAQSVTLTFTAKDAANQHVQLNRVSITNLTKGWQETIYWPDNTLTMQNGTGINDVETHGRTSLQLSQNNPNPFTGTTEVSLTVAEEGEVMLDIADVNGKIVGTHRLRPQTGIHQFRVTLSTAGTYIMTARQNGQTSSIKMVCNGGGDGNRIEYTGNDGNASHASATQPKNGTKYTTTHPFDFGDLMEYVGYASINGTEAESQHIMQAQDATQTLTLQFDEVQTYGQPCPGTATVTDIDGNTYNTVQIGNQCWMKENLRTTRYANGVNIPMGSTYSYTYPYCYAPNNDSSNVSTYGYLYNWQAVHDTSSSSANPSGVQGICPTGWHVPSDVEWIQLTDYVGSQPQYQCNDSSVYIAKALAFIMGWSSSSDICSVGNNLSTNNATGFSALPAGYYYFGDCGGFGLSAFFWSATDYNEYGAYDRGLRHNYAGVYKFNEDKSVGLSVRCVKNADIVPTVTTTSVTSITSSSATCGGNVADDGGGVNVTARGVCWSTTQNPTIADSHTIDGSGIGSYTSSLTGLMVGTTYYVRAYATNNQGTAYGNELCFTTMNDGQPCPGTATVTDIDGNTYNTVQIGNQCWMKENLRTTRYANGTSVTLGSDTSTTTAYCYYPDNDSSNVSIHGYLYNWKAVMGSSSSSSTNSLNGVQGICPYGWLVPSSVGWTELISYVRSQPQYQCDNSSYAIAKALASTTGWNSYTLTCAVGNNPSTNNATGFSALPAGIYHDGYDHGGYWACFWSATENNGNNAYYYGLYNYSIGVDYYATTQKDYGFSVRCIKNEDGNTGVEPTVITTSVTSIMSNSATCGGNVTSDGSSTVTARGVCWSTTQNPTIADDHTINGNGMGSFTSSITGLTPETTYYVRAYATNSVGTAYGSQVSFITTSSSGADGQPCPGAVTVTDIDNNTYYTVKIGNQCWMKENLRTTRYANGVNIPMGSTLSYTGSYRYEPDNDSSNVSTYGYLYNWPAVMHGASSSSANPSGVQGICPNGWHVPSDAEWTQLTDYVRSQTQYQCNNSIAKALASTIGWNSSTETCAVGNNPSANNATGFSVLPAGRRDYSVYHNFGNFAYIWSATEEYNDRAYVRTIFYYNSFEDRYFEFKNYGFSVRCVRD